MDNEGQSTMVAQSSDQPPVGNVPAEGAMQDIELNFGGGDDGDGAPPIIPACATFVKRTASKSPKREDPVKKRQSEESSGEDPNLNLPNLEPTETRVSDVTVLQRGDRYPSTWTLPGSQQSLQSSENTTTPNDQPQVSSDAAHPVGESSEKNEPEKNRALTPPPMALVNKIDRVLSGGPPELVAENNKSHPSMDEDLSIPASSFMALGASMEMSAPPQGVEREISFVAAGADAENQSIPKPGSFVERKPSSTSPKRSPSGESSEREINFSLGGSNIRTGEVPKQGSFIGTSPKRSDSELSREISFIPEDSNNQSSPPVPKQGSFVERDFDPQRSRMSIMRERNSRTLDSRDRLTTGSLVRERNSRMLDGRELQAANFADMEESHSPQGDIPTRSSSGDVVDREINFSPGGSELATAAPPRQGSFVGATPADTVISGGTDIGRIPEKENGAEKAASAASSSPSTAQEISFSPGGSELLSAPPPRQGSFAGQHPTQVPGDGKEEKSREIEFSIGGGSEPLTVSPPKQGSFVGADPVQLAEDVSASIKETGKSIETEAAGTPQDKSARVSRASVEPREINFSPGGSDLVTAPPPSRGSYVGAEDTETSKEDVEKTKKVENEAGEMVAGDSVPTLDSVVEEEAAKSSDAMDAPMEDVDTGNEQGKSDATENVTEGDGSKDMNLSSVGGITPGPDEKELSTAEPNEEEPAPKGEVENSKPAETDVGDIDESKEMDEMDEILLEVKNDAGKKSETDANEDDDDLDLQAEDHARWKAEKSASSLGYNVNKEGGSNDDEMLDMQAEDQARWKAEKSASSLAYVSENDAAKNAAEPDESSESAATDTEMDMDPTGFVESTAAETVVGADAGRESFRPNESILKMEAMLESALNDELDIFEDKEPEETIAKVNKMAGETSLKAANPLETSRADDTMDESGGMVTDDDIPDIGDTSKVDASVRQIEELLDSALTDTLGSPGREQSDKGLFDSPKQAGGDKAIVASTTEDTDDFIPSPSIARMEAALDMALDDDLDLDALLQDSPKKRDSMKKHDATLDALLGDDEIEIAFGPESDSIAESGEAVSKATASTKPSSSRGSTPAKATSGTRGTRGAAANKTSSVQSRASPKASIPGVASRSARKPAVPGVTKEPTKKPAVPRVAREPTRKPVVPRVAKESTRKPPVPRVAQVSNRKPVEPKKQPRRSISDRLFSSKPKSSTMSAGSTKPKSGDTAKTNDKGMRKKGSARRLVSAMTSWTKKKEPQTKKASNGDDDKQVPGVPTTNTRQPRSRPKPVALFSGSKAATEDKTNATSQRSQPVKDPPKKAPETTGGSAEISANPEISTPPRPLHRSPPELSSARSMYSLSSQCSVVSFSSPRREGRFGCQSKFQPYLHASRGPCELCVYFLSDEDKAILDIEGRHFRVMFTSGGCCKTCEMFPREFDEPPVRLCRQCFFNTHREMYRKVAPRRKLLRKKIL